MPNQFDLQGNFINPDYATPQQQEQLRNYANQLQAASIAPTSTSWTGALAQALMGLSAATNANRANQLQKASLQQALENQRQIPIPPNIPSNVPQGAPQSFAPTSRNETVGSANYMSGPLPGPNDLTTVQTAGGPITVNKVAANDMAGFVNDLVMAGAPAGDIGSYNRRKIAGSDRWSQHAYGTALDYAQSGRDEVSPEFANWADKNPGVLRSIMAKHNMISGGDWRNPDFGHFEWNPNVGGGGTRVAQNFIDPNAFARSQIDPNVPESTKQSMQNWATPRVVGTDPYGQPLMASPYGRNAQAPTGNFTPAYPGTVSVTPGGAANVPTMLTPGGLGAGVRGSVQQAIGLGREAAMAGAGTTAQAEELKGDYQRAFIAAQMKPILSNMKDDIQTHGKNMVWGTTSDFVNNIKRALLQHAPGFLTPEQVQGIASADNMEKLTAQLQTIVGASGSQTDQRLFQAIKSTPSLHNTMPGALAIIDMLAQNADLSVKLMQQTIPKMQQQGAAYNHLAEKTQFYKDNGIRNPMTGNFITSELPPSAAPAQGGGDRVINGKTYRKINGKWHEVM